MSNASGMLQILDLFSLASFNWIKAFFTAVTWLHAFNSYLSLNFKNCFFFMSSACESMSLCARAQQTIQCLIPSPFLFLKFQFMWWLAWKSKLKVTFLRPCVSDKVQSMYNELVNAQWKLYLEQRSVSFIFLIERS